MIEKECIFCGTIIDEKDKSKFICADCQRKMTLLRQLEKVDKAEAKIIKATKRYMGRRADIDWESEKYAVSKRILKDEFKFNSTEEVCVALLCERQNIRYFPNYKIGEYSVDFFFPDLKIIFEVDGELYHTDSDKEFLRERRIMSMVGEEYEIVRLGADYIPRYIIHNFKEALSHVVYQRKSNGYFRDTRYDEQYFNEYLNLVGYMRRNR